MEKTSLIKIVADALVLESGVPFESLASADTPLGEGGLPVTSLSFVRAMVRLEDSLGIELEDAIVMSGEFGTLGDVVEFVGGCLAQNQITSNGSHA